MPSRTLARVVIVVAALAALGVVAWQIVRAPETYPYADSATTSIYALRAAKGELATGAYSRFHWNHPGPLLYELLAPAYVLSGRREVSLKWAMLALNIAVLAGLLGYLGRRSRWLCAAVALTLAPLLYFEQRLLFWAWNPVAPLLPLALALTLAAGVCAGDFTALPWLCAAVSFVVQAHVGLAPVSALLAVAAVASVLWRWRGLAGKDRRAAVRALITSAAVAAALWAVPVIHDLRAPPGNLAEIARFFAASHETHPWPQTATVFANELVAAFDPSRELITGAMPAAASTLTGAWAVVQLGLLVVTAVWSKRRGQTFAAAFAALCLLSSIVGLLAVRSIAGDISDYLVIWIGVIGLLNVAALSSCLGLVIAAPHRSPGTHSGWRAAIITYVAMAACFGAVRLNEKQRADAADRTLAHLAGEIEQYCDVHHFTRPLLTFDWKVWGAATGVVLQLYKEGRAVAVNDDARFLFGPTFARTGVEPAELYLMAVEDEAMPAGVTHFDRIATVQGYRVVQVFRNAP